MTFEKFRESIIGQRVEFPEDTDYYGAESVSYTEGVLLVQQTNWSPNCEYNMPLEITDGIITDVSVPTIYETVYLGEYSEAEDIVERDPDDDEDYDYLYEVIADYFPRKGEDQNEMP